MSDDSPVAWGDAVSAWALAARPVLERAAGTYAAYLTYQQLAEAVQDEAGIVTRSPFRHWIGTVLAAVARDRRSADEPMLTALVVRADGTIGSGYAVSVEERDGSAPGDLEMHAAAERLACYRHFGAELPPDGGQPIFTAQVATRRQRRGRTDRPAVRREACPHCYLEMPATGVCDNCNA